MAEKLLSGGASELPLLPGYGPTNIPRMRFFAFISVMLYLAGSPGTASAAPEKKPNSSIERVSDEVVLDGIVASIDDKPITLSELLARLSPPRKLSFKEASKDQEALKTLDMIILERLIEEEASAKKVSISDAEVEDYINEVANRNSLSRPDFEAALKKEGQSIERYRKQIRFDILRSKLMSTMMRGGVSVSDAEVDQYISDHPELSHSGTTLKLSLITIKAQDRSPEQMQTKVAEVLSALDAGDRFADVAQRFSDGPNAAEGGSLGLVAEQDLSGEIFDAVFSIEEGGHSKPIANDQGVQIFYVEQRFSAIDDDDDEERQEAIRQEVKASLQKQKAQERMSSFFISDLYKSHSVDKKL